jgi:hypothetical protein
MLAWSFRIGANVYRRLPSTELIEFNVWRSQTIDFQHWSLCGGKNRAEPLKMAVVGLPMGVLQLSIHPPRKGPGSF